MTDFLFFVACVAVLKGGGKGKGARRRKKRRGDWGGLRVPPLSPVPLLFFLRLTPFPFSPPFNAATQASYF